MFGSDMSLFNARPCRNPGIGGVHHFFQIIIGQHMRRHIGAGADHLDVEFRGGRHQTSIWLKEAWGFWPGESEGGFRRCNSWRINSLVPFSTSSPATRMALKIALELDF